MSWMASQTDWATHNHVCFSYINFLKRVRNLIFFIYSQLLAHDGYTNTKENAKIFWKRLQAVIMYDLFEMSEGKKNSESSWD